MQRTLESRGKIICPGPRVMKRLTNKFLGCEYIELIREVWGLEFTIDSGLPLEDRAAFFAAVTAHTKID